MEVELSTVPDAVRERAVQLAQSLCTDADLYGGHACLACQEAARHLVRRFGEATGLVPPPHGTSLKTSRSHWARLLATVGSGAAED